MSDGYSTTTKQVAKLFGVTIQTAWNWADWGKLDCIRLSNGELRFNDDEFSEWECELEGYALTQSDVAALAGVSQPTVSRWTTSGKLYSKTTPGGKRRYKLSEVERFLALRGITINYKNRRNIRSKKNSLDQEPLLTPSEVAKMFRVDPKTVTRWAKTGKLTAIKTLGGHRRYKESEVRSLLNDRLPSEA